MKIGKMSMLSMMSVGMTLFVLSGCGGSSASKAPEEDPLLPPKEMTSEQARDAMALNAFIYPIIAPVSECFSSKENLKQCIEDIWPDSGGSVLTSKIEPGTYECTPGTDGNGTFTYEYSSETRTRTFTFNEGCADYGNSQRLYDTLIIGSCLLGLEPRPDDGTSDDTYRVEYKGSVVCSEDLFGIKTATNFTYRTIGNGNNQTKSQWSYNGTLDLGANPIMVNGNIRGIAKYAVGSDTPETPWDELFLGSDEEWIFDKVKIALGTAIAFDGKGTYIKHPNDNNNGEGEFYISFASLVYNMVHNGDDITVNISGKVSASCQPIPVTYETIIDMEDVDTIRDANGSRMPSSGKMTMTIPNHNSASAEFAAGSSAEVAITANESTTTYTSWRDIVGASSCAGLQEWLDDISGAI